MKRIVRKFIPRFPIFWRYLLSEFFSVFFLGLFSATSLFLIFETFEKTRVFLRESAPVGLSIAYIILKIPWIFHLMTPVALLIATLISIGRLSQKSEITAMRACGASVTSLAKPILLASAIVSLVMFVFSETILPWALNKGEDIYTLDIRKKAEKGAYNRENFWFRNKNFFYSVGLYNSRDSKLENISIYELDDNFEIAKRTDADFAKWSKDPLVRWTMYNITEVARIQSDKFLMGSYLKLPLMIQEDPKYFYNARRKSETLTTRELSELIKKQTKDGLVATPYKVDLASKLAFPLINIVVVLIAFPLAILPSRSGKLVYNIVIGLAFGFAYYICNAVFTAMGYAELIGIQSAAWATNIFFSCAGVYLLSGAEFKK